MDETKSAAFKVQLKDRNLEQALSRLRRIAGLLTNKQTIDDLTAEAALDLDAAVCVNGVPPARDGNKEFDSEAASKYAASERKRPHGYLTLLILRTDSLHPAALRRRNRRHASRAHDCRSRASYGTQIKYYNNANHDVQVGYRYYTCDGVLESQWGVTSPYYTSATYGCIVEY